MVVCGVDYPVVKTVKSEKIGKTFPVCRLFNAMEQGPSLGVGVEVPLLGSMPF